MKLMVCVKSCLRDFDRGAHDVIRGTWGNALRDFGITTKFFVGQPTDVRRAYRFQSDEVMIEAKDDYASLPYKTRSICRWALGKLIDYVFLADVDTCIYPAKFAAFKCELSDYAGRMWNPKAPYNTVDPDGHPEIHNTCFPYASGGFGYFLSRKACDIVAWESPTSWAEDLWVGQVLGPFVQGNEMLSANIPAGTISTHYPFRIDNKSDYDPKNGWMQREYNAHKEK